MTRRRLPIVALLAINVAVAVVATLATLFVYDSRRQPQAIVLPTFSGVSSQSGVAPASTPLASPEEPGEGEVAGEAVATQEGGEAVTPGGSETGSQSVLHVVQPGDTLFALSIQYDVTVEDIVIANGFDGDTVILDVGQELVIPVGGLPPTLSPTAPQPSPTLALSPIATVTPLPPGTISISIEQIVSPGDVTQEAVIIVNHGSALDMEGWTLSDEAGNEYAFPSFRLFGNGSGVTVHTGVGQDSGRDLYWGRSTAVWGDPSDTAILRNPSGVVQSEFPIENS